MGMATAFLLMKNDGARLAVQSEPSFNGFGGFLEGLDVHPLVRGRIQAQREKELLGAGATDQGVDFVKRRVQVVR